MTSDKIANVCCIDSIAGALCGAFGNVSFSEAEMEGKDEKSNSLA